MFLLLTYGFGCGPQEVGADWTSLQDALDRAAPGDFIEVPAGIHHGQYQVRVPVTIRGAGSEETVLDGYGEGSVVVVFAEARDIHFQGLTITGGTSGSEWLDSTADNSWSAGGGMAIMAPTTLEDVKVVSNFASHGGGIFIGYDGYYFEEGADYMGGSLVARGGVEIADNAATVGAAIFVQSGEVELYGAQVLDNEIQDGDSSAAIEAQTGSLLLGPGTVVAGSFGGQCGAVRVLGASVLFEEAEVLDNVGSEASGACIRAGEMWFDGTLTSIDTSWGPDDGNTDVAVEGVGTYSYGASASFVCDSEMGCQ